MRLLVAFVIAVTALGCAREKLSRPLREQAFADLSAEVSLLPASQSKTRIEALLERLRSQLADEKAVAAAREDIARLAAFAGASAPAAVKLGFATGGKDWNGDGADDGVEIYVTPRDSAGSGVKCPGSATVLLLSNEGRLFRSQKTIDEWVVSTDTLRISWNEGLFPAYILPLPWHEGAPPAGTYELVVEFTPLYGPTLSDRKIIEVRLQ